jgi:hypothetical protein
MPAPDRIKQLVETFEQNINEYRSHKNETVTFCRGSNAGDEYRIEQRVD